MKHSYPAFLALFFLFCRFNGYGQQAEKTVTGTFTHLPFEQLAQQIESQTDYKIYFDPAVVDSLFVRIDARAWPVQAVLYQALQNTVFRFAIDDEHRVFVTKEVAINPALADDFYQARTTGAVVAAEETAPTGPVGRSHLVSASEYKVYTIGTGSSGASRVTLAGHIRDQKSGEPVIGASIYSESPNIGASTDQFGYFSLTMPPGRYDLKIRGVGIKNTKRQVVLQGTGKLEIEVEEDIVTLKEVVVESEKDKNVSGMQMGVEKLDIKTMRQVPTAFGETDILRVVMTLPGVKTVGEGSTGLNVRGGATDQNLILFNDATIYNPSQDFPLDPRVLVERYEGVQQHREFYAPRYDTPEATKSRLPDLRNLLYWNPDINLANAEAQTLDFYTGDQAGRYLVVLQGLATDGRAGSRSFVLDVKPAL